MNHFSAAMFFTLAIQLFCALAGGLTAFFVIDMLEPMVMTAMMRPRLTFPRNMILRWGGFAGFGLLVFFLVGEVGSTGGGAAGGGGQQKGKGVGGIPSDSSPSRQENTETVVAKKSGKDIRVRVLAPEIAAKLPGAMGDTRRLFLYWDGPTSEPELLDYHATREKIDGWRKNNTSSTEPRLTLVYTNDDPDDASPIIVGFSRFLNDLGVALERRTANDFETAAVPASKP